MKLSIALCTYNGAAYVDVQLHSIANQTRLPDELVVCDDGSVDETLLFLRRFAAAVTFPVRIVENRFRLGSTANFSQAIGLCTGDIVVLADQDDVWHIDKLKCIESALKADPDLGGIFSDGILIDERGRTLRGSLWCSVGFVPKKKAFMRAKKGPDALLQANFVTGATLAFRAHLKDLLLPIPSGWVHDYWIAFLLAAASQLDFIDAPLIEYRCHPFQQLGVKRSVAELWHRFFENDNTAYLAAEARWIEVCERLRGNPIGQSPISLLKCEAMAAHMHRRGTLPHQRLHRLPTIFKETVNGNYFRYSLGTPSIVRDILAG